MRGLTGVIETKVVCQVSKGSMIGHYCLEMSIKSGYANAVFKSICTDVACEVLRATLKCRWSRARLSHVTGLFCSHAEKPQLLSPIAGQQRRYAVIGGGFAGIATAWHLLAHADAPVSVHLFDGAGIAGGASGAAAGLLHPYSPKGKVSTVPHCCHHL